MTARPGLMTAGSLLASAAARHGDRLAFVCTTTGRSTTFRAFEQRVDRLAGLLSGLSLEPGDVVAFLGSNRIELVEIYYAVGRSGLVGLPLSSRFTARDMTAAIASVGAKLVLYEAAHGALAEAIRGDCPTVRRFISFGGASPDDDYETLLSRAVAPRTVAVVADDDPFYFNVTSGTTGHPKSYLLSHRNNTTVAPFIEALDLTRADVVMTVFPLSGRVGFGWTTVSLFLGIPNVLTDFEPARVLQLIEAHRVSAINLVPTMAAMLVPVQTRERHDLSALRTIILAGAPCSETLWAATAATLCPTLYEFYGMNEMGPLCTSRPADHAERPGSVGKPLLFSAVRVVGPEGEDLAPGEVGEVLGRSPMATEAYHGNPDATAETFRDGWVHTGDLGCLDQDGFLSLRGRKKDMIVTGGQNVYAAEVETVLAQHPGVAECAVIGLPDDLWGERVVAVVVPGPVGVAPEALLAHCRDHLSGYKVPKSIVLHDAALPRTSTTKVQKFLLIERYSGRAPA